MFQLQDKKQFSTTDLLTIASFFGLMGKAVGIGWSEDRLPRRLAQLSAHLVVALIALVGIGGATRVMEAGLACPDWPLCYGSLLPGGQMNVQVFLEWFHRLDAFVVGVALLVLAAVSLAQRHRLPSWLPWASSAALALVAIQGGLGALTVIALLPSGIVTAHLTVALALVILLSGITQGLLAIDRGPSLAAPPWWLLIAGTSMVVVLTQCLLGGAMATQWAADRCMQSGDGCGLLGAHRQVASFAAGAVVLQGLVSLPLLRSRPSLGGFSLAASALVILQVALGLFTLRLQLQAPAVTVAHQLVAALLVAVLAAGLARQIITATPAQTSTHLEVAHG